MRTSRLPRLCSVPNAVLGWLIALGGAEFPVLVRRLGMTENCGVTPACRKRSKKLKRQWEVVRVAEEVANDG